MSQTSYPLVKSLLMDLNYLITSNDFSNVFSSEHVSSNKMRTYCPRRVFGPLGPKTRGGTLGIPA